MTVCVTYMRFMVVMRPCTVNIAMIVGNMIMTKMSWMRMPIHVVVLIFILSMVTAICMLKMVIMPILMTRMRVTCVCVLVQTLVSSIICITM